LRPLNVPQSESLYAIEWGSDHAINHSYPDYLDLRDRNHSFDDLLAYNISVAGLDSGGEPVPAWIYEASGNYFDALHIQPFLGRFFHASDEHGENSVPYIVLSYAYWHTHFQDDRGVIGRTVQVNKHPFTVAGVAPADFHGTLLFFNPAFYVPLVDREEVEGATDLNARGSRWMFMVMGHLKAGVPQAQAIADLNAIGADLEKNFPKDDGNMRFTLNRPSLYGDYLGKPVRQFMTGLLLLSGLILLAACANLGSLFAARAADRSKEVAIRLALGSTRGRILRRLFTEAILISLAGGAVGLWGSSLLLQALSVWQPFPKYPLYLSVVPDGRVYLFALLVSVASGFLFGAVPVRQVLQTDPYGVIKAGWIRAGGRRVTARDVLLVAQIAICAVLITSSIVAVRGLRKSLHSNFGFDVQQTVLVETDFTMAGYRKERVLPLQKQMIETLQAIPGVEAVGLADAVPLSTGAPSSLVFKDEAADERPVNAATETDTFCVSPDYFRAAGTALLSGRDFTWHDDASAPRVAVINPELAHRLFGSASSALGGYFKTGDGARVQVIGITEQGKYDGLTESPQPALFLAMVQAKSGASSALLRTQRDPQQLAPVIRERLWQLDPGLPVSVEKRNQTLDFVLFGPRMATIALGVMGGMGAMLAITGIFGMAAYSVSKRLKELGIRIAIGAQPKEILKTALRRPFWLLAFGSGAGLILGILAAKVLALIVDQATPRDPVVLVGAVVAMMLLGLVATWIPARRALRVDPMMLLREE